MFHYLHYLSLDDQHFDDFFPSYKFSACLISSVSDYDLGGAGDLFKAPQPILEPPVLTLDHMTSSMFKEDLISQEVEFTNVESPQNETSITNIFQEFEDILSNEPSSPSQIMNSNGIITEENLHPLGKITKSVSSYCLTSMDDGPQTRPNSVTDTKMKGHGLRRAFSEGCIKAQLINDHLTETRMQKLSRYREKKMKRNFKRKVKIRLWASIMKGNAPGAIYRWTGGQIPPASQYIRTCMLVGKHWQIINQGSEEGLPRKKKPTCLRK